MKIFSYTSAQYEHLPCNFCGEDNADTIATRDRNGYSVRTLLCRNCGLLYIDPRMTPQWYQLYYEQEYRHEMARFKGLNRAQTYTSEILFNHAKKRTKPFFENLRPYVNNGLTIEVGSSTGGVLAGFRDVFGSEVLGIEPSPEEAQYAESQGVRTIQSMFESLGEGVVPKAENIISLRALNHMLDFHSFLVWANKHLAFDGRLILEVMHFPNVVEHYGYLPRGIQIDHVFMFTPETLRQFLEALGFTVMTEGVDRKAEHMYIVAKKTAEVSAEGARNKKYTGYSAVRAWLNQTPSSYLTFLFKYDIKKKIKVLSYKIRRTLKHLLVLFGLYREGKRG
ncbi:hypothetical protein COU17_02770 [Candidatus Kaiserbacteria bacterium CG10_big_fil_rev_8_21_14_0_10_49_17]|uniref:Class I SAM-dependent methyltransferase n=1 Tax=Candidatus Kaiserbacteria bacterium CG10_big_fil_rev_8_21_14_0_10_49_17 TaxID=1974609 RepID=A0A2M6WDW9_9BACT|nr:MAG: hypothetical protein COU17_02770 [Candidatus Kaiserbacteria bacterium CG10_big_fil_rev_8_21_14_0_10_49_17]